MTEGLEEALCDHGVHSTRTQRRYRLLSAVGIAAALGLGINAPALAAGDEDPTQAVTRLLAGDPTDADQVQAASSPEIPVTATELPPVPVVDLADAEQIVTTTDVDDGLLSVSVRVLSPGTDGTVSQQGSDQAVVSPQTASDITPSDGTLDGDAAQASDESVAAEQVATMSTNVSIRVLSPGDNGPVTQTAVPAGDFEAALPADEDAAALPVGNEAEPVDEDSPSAASGTAPGVDDNDARYQHEQSQYHSAYQSSEDSWLWRWVLSIDCAGNASSSATTNGSQSSMIWIWDWVWDWSCASAEDAASDTAGKAGIGGSAGITTGSTTTSPAGDSNISIGLSSPGDNGPVGQTSTSSPSAEAGSGTSIGAADEPWVWSWTFTFCGETTTLATDVASGTPLDWTWTWAWNWTCDSAMGAPPVLGDVAPGGAPTQPPALPAVGSPVLASTPAPFVAAGGDSSSPPVATLAEPLAADLEISMALDVPISVDVDLGAFASADITIPEPSGVAPNVVGAVLAGAVFDEREPDTWNDAHMIASHRTVSRGTPLQLPAAAALPATPAHEAEPEARPVKRPTARKASPRPLGDAPFGQRRSASGEGSGASGGRVPSAPLLAVAALIAFLMLAAPGLGRRVLAVRELSPRGTYRSPIDHPG